MSCTSMTNFKILGYSDQEVANFLFSYRKRKGLSRVEYLELLNELCGQQIESKQGRRNAKEKFERLKSEL